MSTKINDPDDIGFDPSDEEEDFDPDQPPFADELPERDFYEGDSPDW